MTGNVRHILLDGHVYYPSKLLIYLLALAYMKYGKDYAS